MEVSKRSQEVEIWPKQQEVRITLAQAGRVEARSLLEGLSLEVHVKLGREDTHQHTR